MLTTFTTILLAVLGLAVGSFLNALAWRLHRKKKIGNDRSMCPHCRHKLAAVDLVPVLSYVWLKGRCRYCHKKISWHYPVVEATTAAAFVAVAFTTGGFDLAAPTLGVASAQLAVRLLFVSFLVFLALYDWQYQLILNRVLIPFFFISILGALVLNYSLTSIVVGAAVAGIFFGVLFFASGGKWIGAGDVKLGPILGIVVGFPGILLSLLVAYVGGALISLLLLATKRKKRTDRIPFAGFLALGTLITLLWGNQIISWYVNLFQP